MASLSAVVLGGTGAVGGQVLKHLLSRPEKWSNVVLIGRRKIALEPHPGVEVEQHLCDMTDPDTLRQVRYYAKSGPQYDMRCV